MAVVSMKQFIESGVHYGHQTRRWNPKMKPYIFGVRHGVHIIDLQKSLRMLRDAFQFIRDIAGRGESVLFVGTKPQAREIIRDQAIRSNSFYINERWLGGLLTNFNTVKQSITHLKKMEDQRGEDGLYEGIIKKEAMRMEKKRIKLEKALGGIKEMRKIPGVIFVIDCKKERIALQEAQKLGIPIVAVVDTNCDPDHIDYIIPGNDDAIRAIELFTSTLANAVLEGNALYEAQAKAAPREKPRAGRGRAAEKGAEKAAEKTTEKAAKAPQAGKDAPESTESTETTGSKESTATAALATEAATSVATDAAGAGEDTPPEVDAPAVDATDVNATVVNATVVNATVVNATATVKAPEPVETPAKSTGETAPAAEEKPKAAEAEKADRETSETPESRSKEAKESKAAKDNQPKVPKDKEPKVPKSEDTAAAAGKAEKSEPAESPEAAPAAGKTDAAGKEQEAGG